METDVVRNRLKLIADQNAGPSSRRIHRRRPASPDVSAASKERCHAGATVFAARVADETTDIMQRYRAHLVAKDSHNAEEVFNDNVALEAFHSLERASSATATPS
jgi:hypothetical protein